MAWFKNLAIHTKLLMGFFVISLLSALVGVVGIMTSNELGEVAVQVYQSNLRPITHLTSIRASTLNTTAYVRDMILFEDRAEFQRLKTKIEGVISKNNQLISEYENSGMITIQGEREAFERFKAKLLEFRAVRSQIIQLIEQGKREEARALITTVGRERINETIAAVNAIIDLNVKDAERVSIINKERIAQARSTLMALVVGGFLASLVLGLLIARVISSPIKRLDAAAEQLAKGNFAVQIQADSRDEIGSLTASFGRVVATLNKFAQAQITMKQQHDEGFTSYTIAAKDFEGKYAELAEGTNALAKSHINVTTEILGVIAEYSNGNFASDISRMSNERAKITQSIDAVKANLQAINREILRLSDAAIAGNLATRGDASQFQYTFRAMVEGINNTLDAVVNPLNVAANYVARISQGEIPSRIQEQYNGDFAALKNNMNTLIDTLNAFIAAQEEMARQHDAGMISYRIPAKQFSGAYATMVQGVNELVAAHIGVKMRVVEVISQYALGNFTVDMDRLPGEKAKITQSIDTVKANLQAINREILRLSDAAVRGNLSERGHASQFQYTFRDMVEGINKTLDAVIMPVNEAQQVLQSMAAGDLTKTMQGNYEGDHARLKRSLNATIESINTTLSQVIITAEQVLQGSRQVSSASQSLSQGATEQAASLEEISSSMQQITSQTKLNAENANQANQLAQTARGAAERGNSDMQELIAAMADINESSKNISRIIKVIDEIAFQTNLLALNAAVEAARAGRHGKGFAVVAEEVRNLAAHSAKAAKETEEMIAGAVKKAEHGAATAGRTETGLKEIVTVSSKVTDIVAEIAAASNEQAQGIGQINMGLSQIDTVTQQNTANAEESAAAAEELSSQSRQLDEMLSRFRLNTATNGSYQRLSNGHGNSAAQTNAIALQASAARHTVNASYTNGGRALSPEEIISLDDNDFGRY